MFGFNSLKINLIDSLDGLYQIAPQWSLLQTTTQRSTVFQSWEWCYSWWEVFSDEYDRLATVCVYDHEELVMILPLIVENHDQGQARFLLIGHNVSDYSDCLVKSGYETKLDSVLLTVMRQQGISQLRTEDVPPWASLYQTITELRLNEDTNVVERWHGEKCPYIVLQSTWEAYLASRSANHRSIIRRALRRVDNAGLKLGYYDQPDQSLIGAAINLHCQWLEYRGLATVFNQPGAQRFIECALERLLKANKARLFTLKNNNDLVGFYLVLRDRTWFYYYISGLNRDFLELSPGNAILAHIIRVGISEGMYGVDLMRGDEAYKYKWATGEVTPLVVDINQIKTSHKLIRATRRPVMLRTWAKRAKNFFGNKSLNNRD